MQKQNGMTIIKCITTKDRNRSASGTSKQQEQNGMTNIKFTTTKDKNHSAPRKKQNDQYQVHYNKR